MSTKIPKILHFIWFGDVIPEYVSFSIENFRKVNPDFEIDFVNRTLDEINDIKMNNVTKNKTDELILKSMERILSNEDDSFVNF